MKIYRNGIYIGLIICIVSFLIMLSAKFFPIVPILIRLIIYIDEINEFIFGLSDGMPFDAPELCLAQRSMTQWLELFACGGYAARRGTSLLMVDNTSLDSLSDCLEFISNQHRLKKLVFVGSRTSFAKRDRDMFCSVLKGNELE